MVKKDGDNSGPEEEQIKTNPERATEETEQHTLTHVDNAHASGLGAMGRNDEKLPTGAEEEAGPEDPMY